jgi:polyhydroxyalkanoate synthesis regulator protein
MIAFCIAILCLGAWMPVPARQADKAHVIEKPSALKQVEQWIEELRKEETVSPQNLAEVEEKMEELLRRPNEQWYEHASLEAADHLRDQTGKDLQELGAQLEQTQGSLSTLAELSSQLSEEAKSGLSKQLENQLKGLRSGAMQTSGDLAEQLKNMDPKACNGMSKEQMQKLAERLKQNAEALRKALANAPQFSFKECKSCNKPGEGGKPAANRGRGDAELTVNEKETNLNTTATDKLASMIDPERVTPGDLIGLQDARPTAKENFTGPQAGGTLQSTGEGGAAVEKATLVPAERAVLKRFFK